jgi:hypothetical protein
MKTKFRVGSFKARSLQVAAAASEVARATGQDITVDLFSPRRKCTRCAHKAEVFIGPKHVCAACWMRLVNRYAGAGGEQFRAQAAQ